MNRLRQAAALGESDCRCPGATIGGDDGTIENFHYGLHGERDIVRSMEQNLLNVSG